MAEQDLAGQQFHWLTAVEPCGRNGSNQVLWACLCKCGNKTRTAAYRLTAGRTKSCGCWLAASRKRAVPDRFWERVAKRDDGCWLWIGRTSAGYGIATLNNHTVLAHRVAYEILAGPIPSGLTLDHLCRVRNCVNPAHLEPVTGRENSLRGTSPPANNARKTHCYKGHPLSGENLRMAQGQRNCRECQRVNQREKRAIARTG